MFSKSYSSIQSFWEAISHLVKQKNYPTYHPCCRVWTGRTQKQLRESHTQKLTWGSVLGVQCFTEEDTIACLTNHMLEHQWGTPIILNKPCSARVSPAALNQALQKSETQPKPPSSAKPFQLHPQPVIPNSPFSTPAMHLEPLRDSEAQTLGADPRRKFSLDFEISNTR